MRPIAPLVVLLIVCASLLLAVKIDAMVFQPNAVRTSSSNSFLGRRCVLTAGISATASAAALLLLPCGDGSSAALAADDVATFQAYHVEPDSSAAPTPKLVALRNDSFLNKIASIKGGTLWLGEHHNAVADHSLQVELLRQIAARRRKNTGPVAVGLEQVQVKFQPVLDAFTAGAISADQMRVGVEWDTRWIWPFEVYQPVFDTARELRMPLIALNVNTEDLALVEKGGLPGLPRDRLQAYIRDASGFAAFARQPQFRTYVDYVIKPSYEIHQAMGLLQYTMSGEKLDQQMPFRNFLSGRILWDEAMASNAYEWTRRNKGGLLVGLVGADHVKFRDGIPGRHSRMIGDGGDDCISVMLNPTLIDTRPPGTVENTDAAISSQIPGSITLQLRYLNEDTDLAARTLPKSSGGVLPLADYLVIGKRQQSIP